MGVTFTAETTVDRGTTHEYLVQVRPAELAALDGVTAGSRVVLQSEHDGVDVQVHATVTERSDGLEEGHVGVDGSLRCALGITPGTTVRLLADDSLAGQPARLTPSLRRWIGRRLAIRVDVCRTKIAVNPDFEHRVCRITEDTMQLIGIEPGDRVVLESPHGSVTNVKALPITDDVRTRQRTYQNGSCGSGDASGTVADGRRDVDSENCDICVNLLGLNEKHFSESLADISLADDDIREIYLDRDLREKLGLRSHGHQGLCQPIRVSRDPFDFVAGVFHDISLPIVLASFAVVVALDTLTWAAKGLILSMAVVLVVVVAIAYRSRQF